MTPLRWFYGLYILTLGVTLIVGFVAVEYVRWPMVVLGVLLAVFGGCLVTNALGFATETATNTGKSKWVAPVMASVPLVRAMGAFMLLVGIGFAAQALLVDNL